MPVSYGYTLALTTQDAPFLCHEDNVQRQHNCQIKLSAYHFNEGIFLFDIFPRQL